MNPLNQTCEVWPCRAVPIKDHRKDETSPVFSTQCGLVQTCEVLPCRSRITPWKTSPVFSPRCGLVQTCEVWPCRSRITPWKTSQVFSTRCGLVQTCEVLPRPCVRGRRRPPLPTKLALRRSPPRLAYHAAQSAGVSIASVMDAAA